MRLLSYNIHKGIGGRDRRYSFRRIIDVIEQENPDIMCLQEVDRNVPRSNFDDQAKVLAEYFNAADLLYQINVNLKSGGYGNLLLSRWKFTTHHQISLRQRQKKPRRAQLAVIDTPEGPLHLVNCHLGLAERERRWQVRHLMVHRLFRESAHLPTMIIGDFNDWRNQLCNGQFGANDFQQITAPISRFRSFPAYLPVGSLDKAFYRGKLTVRHARVVRTQLAHESSDHLPLVIDFHMTHPEPPTHDAHQLPTEAGNP